MCSRSIHTYFIPSRSTIAFGISDAPCKLNCKSSPFYPPHRHRISQDRTSTLRRNHLTSRTTSRTSWASSWKCITVKKSGWYGISPVNALDPCKIYRPQSHIRKHSGIGTSSYLADSPFLLPCAETGSHNTPATLLPIASFRPRNYSRRPCDSDWLPPERGDFAFFQTNGNSSFAGQTKKRPSLQRAF